MPCPYFEPRSIAAEAEYGRSLRLPLLDEYDGVCHATNSPFPVPRDLRFRCCNHGYPVGTCGFFPSTESRSCIRFDIIACTEEAVELLFIAERDHAPVDWRRLRFLRSTEQVQPALSDSAARAQVVSFCRSYLRRFSR